LASPDGTDTASLAESNSDGPGGESGDEENKKFKKPKKPSRLKQALKGLGSVANLAPALPSIDDGKLTPVKCASVVVPPINARRVLYTANAGDARGVLCRGGKAMRLTYDHKGSDKQEAKRITDAGGFVMSGRVNGVLAVTRSLGDSSMKEYVVGAPYTTETELCDDDEFLILACDGVCFLSLLIACRLY
jgi:protein phosphatase PTC1